ncbi:MAG: pectate lyase [Bacteroidales bacterium]|nr:pectate lyase [Bacteroidales bacterium]
MNSKKTFRLTALLWAVLTAITTLTSLQAQNLASMTWGDICAGKMGSEWYGSGEAMEIANIVLYVQKANGGWMKNDQIHQLTNAEQDALHNKRNEHSCLDNGATTMEMRFLAKVWQQTQVEEYQEAFLRALNMIFQAEKKCGGWSQYWPLSGGGSYQDYITFNDDLITNVLKLLRDIADNKGDFKDITTEAARERCRRAFDKTIDMIIRCQVDDNGTPAAWCAQHDTTTLLPAEGRPHELPSISGYESAALLSFLMSIDHPSAELQQTIHTAIAWLDAHKIPGKAIEDFTNAQGEKDRRIIDKAGSAIWGRFIQLGGETGAATYQAFFNKLQRRGKSRSYTTGGKTYTYSEYEIATTSYNPDMAYQPIYAIYDDQLQHLYYRFLYHFEDSDPVVDSKGLEIVTSLNALRRRSYQFLGSWCLGTIQTEYPAWKQRIAQESEGEGYLTYELNSGSYTESQTSGNTVTYSFDDGLRISNTGNKGYSSGLSSIKAIKYSSGVGYTILLPSGMKVSKIKFYGYDNYSDGDSYISQCNGKSYSSGTYVFPAKDAAGNAKLVSHTIEFATPAQNSISFTLGGKQCGLAITLFVKDPASGLEQPVNIETRNGKYLRDGQLIIVRDDKEYNLKGSPIK